MLCARHTVGSQGREGGLGNSQTPPDMSQHHSAVERGDNQGAFKPVGDAGWQKDPECMT